MSVRKVVLVLLCLIVSINSKPHLKGASCVIDTSLPCECTNPFAPSSEHFFLGNADINCKRAKVCYVKNQSGCSDTTQSRGGGRCQSKEACLTQVVVTTTAAITSGTPTAAPVTPISEQTTPTAVPTTGSPTKAPITPIVEPTAVPTTGTPTTASITPISEPTTPTAGSPTKAPITPIVEPTAVPTTGTPTAAVTPISEPTTPTAVPATGSPTKAPITPIVEPTAAPSIGTPPPSTGSSKVPPVLISDKFCECLLPSIDRDICNPKCEIDCTADCNDLVEEDGRCYSELATREDLLFECPIKPTCPPGGDQICLCANDCSSEEAECEVNCEADCNDIAKKEGKCYSHFACLPGLLFECEI